MSRRRKRKGIPGTYGRLPVVPLRGIKPRKFQRDFNYNLLPQGAELRRRHIRLSEKLDLQSVEDNRTRRTRIPRTIHGLKAKIKQNNRRHFRYPFVFRNPEWVIECIRRKNRRRAIMADPQKRKKGSGAKSRRPPKYRGIRC